MPYIPSKHREKLDPLIKSLAEEIVKETKIMGDDHAFAGFLNYVCTSLVLRVVRALFGKMRYWIVAIITGTFENVKQEFYRRVAVPYEGVQIKKSDDVPLYKEYEKEIEKE